MKSLLLAIVVSLAVAAPASAANFSGTSPKVSFTLHEGQIDKFKIRAGYICRRPPAEMVTFRASGIVLRKDGSFRLRVEQRGEFLVTLKGKVSGKTATGTFNGLRNTADCSNDGTGNVKWSARSA
jgi:hypothetical protein